MLKSLILCAGRGIRMKSYSLVVPKPLLVVPGHKKPLMHELIQHLRSQHLNDITISLAYKKEFIKAYCIDEKLDVRILESEYSYDTAGTARFYLDNGLLKSEDSLLMINGDIFTTMDFNRMFRFHQAEKSDFTIAYKDYIKSIPFGVLSLEQNKVVSVYEKPSYSASIIIGIYILSYGVISTKLQPGEVIDMPSLIDRCIKDRNVVIKGYKLQDEEIWTAFEFEDQIKNNINIEDYDEY